MFNMNIKFPLADREKQQEKGYPELLAAFKKIGRGNSDLSSIDHEKKELFESFEGTISNSIYIKILPFRSCSPRKTKTTVILSSIRSNWQSPYS